MSNDYMKKLFEGVPDPDDECYQVNFRIKDKREFIPSPANLKAHFLHRASPLIDEYIDAALGNSTFSATSDHARFEVWTLLKTIIIEAKNPAPILDIKGKTIDDQVSQILTLASTGKCTLEEARDFLSLVQQGFELTELPEIMKKMESLEALGVL